MTPPICPEHHLETRRVDDAVVYGKSYGHQIWICPKYPACTWRVGAHKDGRPLGTMANDALRIWRMRAHDAFDGWRRRAGISRRQSYKELAERLALRPADAHIGRMDITQCQAVVVLFRTSVVDKNGAGA